MASTLGLAILFSIIWTGLSDVTGADSQSRQPYTLRTCLMTRICIGTISSCALTFSPMACLRQPQAQVSSCSGSPWTTSIRGKSAGSGLRLPRSLVGVTTSSSPASSKGSARVHRALTIKRQQGCLVNYRFTAVGNPFCDHLEVSAA